VSGLVLIHKYGGAPPPPACTQYISASTVIPPPTTGTYDYNTFTSGASSFIAVGGAYNDPIFSTQVRRLTNHPGDSDDQQYSRWAGNADGSWAFANQDGIGRVVSVSSGTVLYSSASVPLGTGTLRTEVHWHPTNPYAYFYLSSASLVQRNVTTGTNTVIKSFPSNLQSLGGTLNMCNSSARYYIVRYGTSTRVYDSTTDTTYAGIITTDFVADGGYHTITPDGNYLVFSAGPTAVPNKEHYSYAINHSTQTVSTTPVNFWTIGGDHGAVVSASDGKSYWCGFDIHLTPGLWRVDITLPQSGTNASTQALQNSQNQSLVLDGWDQTGNGFITNGPTGAYNDWIFYSSVNYNDTYSTDPTGWIAWEQEIIAINVVTLEVRRLAHHRSRWLDSGSPWAPYWNHPRVSCSPNASTVLWFSNFNGSTSGYADLYALHPCLD
jgi:hypothetical protein